MARRVEEDEGYWPGFVDALATIVMVVTFLLIILGVAIFAISTQVTKSVRDSQEATAEAKAEIAQSQQVVEQQTAQAQAALRTAAQAQRAAEVATAQVQAIQQSSQSEAIRLAAELAEKQTESQKIAAELRATAEAMAEQAARLTQQQQAAAVLEQQAEAAKTQVEQVTTELEETRQALETREQEVTQLSESVATLSEAAATKVMQAEAVEAENAMRISSSTVAIDPAEIEVTVSEVVQQAGEVEVTSAREVLTIRFQQGAIDLNEAAAAEAQAFVELNREVLDQHVISLWSFYDKSSLSVTQVKRTAYFRMLAVRNVLLDAGFDAADIDISVRVAEKAADVDTVQIFLQAETSSAQ